MIDLIQFIFLFIYSFTIIIVFFIERKKKDLLSPAKILIYFSAIECFGFIWFYFNPLLMNRIVYSMLPFSYRNELYIIEAYFISFFIFIVSYFSIRFGLILHSSYPIFKIIKFNSRIDSLFTFKYCIIIFVFAVVLYLYIINSLGGLLYVWLNIFNFSELSKGFGYHLTLYNYMLFFSSTGLFYYFIIKKKRVSAIILLLLSILLLVSMGHRAPVAVLITILIFIYNYKIERINKIFNFKNFLVIIATLIFMQFVVDLRSNFFLESDIKEDISIKEKFTRDIILRLGIFERQILVVGYFKENEFWYGKTYSALFSGIKPSSQNYEKLPLDAGVYLKTIAEGKKPFINKSGSNLSETSWPEKNLVGYIEYGYLGLFLVCFMSGLFYSFLYKSIEYSNFSLSAIFSYGFFSYQGMPNLSTLYLVRILTFYFFLFFLFFVSKLFFNYKLSK
jgi:hypothetical protein